jgi:hypothetical protein
MYQKSPFAMSITISSEESGICFVARCDEAKITQGNGVRTLDIQLRSDAPVANHGNPALRGKQGYTLIDELFGRQEDMDWGTEREEQMVGKKEYSVMIADKEHPVRWTAGRGFAIINGYAALHLRPKYKQPHIVRLADFGGFGNKDDLFNPAKGILRETAEELMILDKHQTLLVPKWMHTRKTLYGKVNQVAAQETDLYYAGVDFGTGKERIDLAQDSLVTVSLDGKRRYEEHLLFRYDPSAHCGIDTLMAFDLRFERPLEDLLLGFGEYWHNERKEKMILGPKQDMAFIKIEDLLEEFDNERPRFVEGILTNAYNKVWQVRRFHPHHITGSVKDMLAVMKRKGYRYSL